MKREDFTLPTANSHAFFSIHENRVPVLSDCNWTIKPISAAREYRATRGPLPLSDVIQH